jgi:hypothetical protein
MLMLSIMRTKALIFRTTAKGHNGATAIKLMKCFWRIRIVGFAYFGTESARLIVVQSRR